MHLFKTGAVIATALALASCSAPLQSPIVSSDGESAARSTAVKSAGGIAQWGVLPPGLRRSVGLSSRSVNRDSYFNCPPKRALIYQSDFSQNVINIYLGDLTLCGLLTGFNGPQGIAINNHNLYVADTGNHRIEAFHRGVPEPYLTFTDPFGQIPVDVAISPDGTVIASNISTETSVVGSISTFKSNGRFVEAYLLKDEFQGSYITTFSNGVTYVDGFDINGAGALWQVSCPGGFCGASTELGTPFTIPGGLDESN